MGCRTRRAARFQCLACGQLVSARAGTAYAGIRTELSTYRRGATALAEGLSIRATGRLLGVDKDTVNQWLVVLGRHCQEVMNYFFRNLHLHQCQLDELWTFIYKKEDRLTPLEKLAAIYGDPGYGLPSVRCTNWCRPGWWANALCPTHDG